MPSKPYIAVATLAAALFAGMGHAALCAPVVYAVAPGPGQQASFKASTQTEHYGGHTDQVSGTVTYDSDAPQRSTAQMTVQLSSLSTDNALRDSRMRGSVLQTEQYPAAVFVLTHLALPTTPTPVGQTVRVMAQGILALHGVTRPVAVPVDVTRETGASGRPGLHIVTRFAMHLKDYNIAAPRFLFFSVRQEHTLTADLHAVAPPPRERLPAPARK